MRDRQRRFPLDRHLGVFFGGVGVEKFQIHKRTRGWVGKCVELNIELKARKGVLPLPGAGAEIAATHLRCLMESSRGQTDIPSRRRCCQGEQS